jgi:hypothetical protein
MSKVSKCKMQNKQIDRIELLFQAKKVCQELEEAPQEKA